MESPNQNINITSIQNEISLKDVVLKIGDWINYLLTKKFIIIAFTCIGMIAGIIYSINKRPSYLASLTFVLEDNKSSSLGTYMGLASQFGIDLGSSMENGVFSGDNILEFLKSRLIIERALLSPIMIDNKRSSLADFYIDFSKMRAGWKDNPNLFKLYLSSDQSRNGFSRQQDSVLFIIYKQLLKKHLEITKPNKKLSFIEVDCISENEFFSKTFTEQLVKEATNFYIETRTKRSKTNVDKLQARADSLEALLMSRSYSAAISQDLNLNPARRVATLTLESQERKKMMAQTMYGEVVRNLELAKVTMLQDVPVIQTIDRPILPLEKKKFGKVKGIILGGFLGSFLIILTFIIIKIWREELIGIKVV